MKRLKTLADLRRAMQPGAVIEVTEHFHPELCGRRTVTEAKSREWVIALPEGHPKHGQGSHLQIPRRDDVTFLDDGSVQIFSTGIPMLKFHFLTDDSAPERRAHHD